MKFGLVVALALGGVACSRLGPAPAIEVVQAETKAQKKVQHILVQPTTGTGTADPESDLSKTVPAGAYERYKDNIVLTAGLENAIDTLGMPEEVVPVLPVNWQVEFYEWVKATSALKPKEKAKAPKEIPVPSYGKRAAKTDKDLKKLAAALKKKKKLIADLAKAVEAADPEKLKAEREKAGKGMQPIENLLRHIMDRLEVTYVLVSHLEGDQKSFDKDLPVVLHVALVNAKTGKFRYYAVSKGKKSDLPVTFDGLFGILAHNMFEDLADVDKIDL